MQLLKPNQVKDGLSVEQGQKAKLLSTLNNQIESAKSVLSQLEVHHKANVELNTKEIQFLEQQYTSRKTTLDSELQTLEDRHRKLMEPIEAVKAEADQKLQEAKQQLAEVTEKAIQTEQLEDTLYNRLDSLTEREANVSQREQQVKVDEDNLESRKLLLAEISQEVDNKTAEFDHHTTEIEAQHQLTENRLTALELSLNQQKTDLDIKATALTKQQQSLGTREETLRQAFQEAEKKNII